MMRDVDLMSSEFYVGSVDDAPTYSLVIGRTPYEYNFLIGASDEGKAAILLDDRNDSTFPYFGAEAMDGHKGIIIPNIEIEVSLSNFGDTEPNIQYGNIARRGSQMLIFCQPDRGMRGFLSRVAIQAQLPLGEQGEEAIFTTWSINIGEGATRRCLWRRAQQPVGEGL